MNELVSTLHRIDGRGYKAYKDIQGAYRGDGYDLHILYVQGDPFAAPSRIEIRVGNAVAGYPDWAFASRERTIGFCDWVNRRMWRSCPNFSSRMGTGKGGQIQICPPSQKVLARTAVQWDGEGLRVRLSIGLPARGRSVMGRAAADLFGDSIPDLLNAALVRDKRLDKDLQRHVETVEDAAALRAQLRERKLVAFVGDGAVLPRRSGVDDRGMDAGKAVAFASPESLRVTLKRPNGGELAGMGLPEGVSLIVGGGFHGKSTLLEALQAGVYNHPPGDGRETVVTRGDAAKIRAEDGRSVVGTDISAFIRDLPDGTDTAHFGTLDASGSTSQAAAIAESLEAGSQLLLIDEDTSATNFMIRDRRMQSLIHRDGEPITPLIERIRALYTEAGVSTILVMGGSGDFFDVADTVVGLRNYRVEDLTVEARRIAEEQPRAADGEPAAPYGAPRARRPNPRSIDPSSGRRDVKTRSRALRAISFGQEEIELDAVEQLVETAQLNAIAAALVDARDYFSRNREAVLSDWLKEVESRLGEAGPEWLARRAEGDFASFRGIELAAALNRLRSLRLDSR